MPSRRRKGKRKATRSPSPSSSGKESDDDIHMPIHKRSRLSSPARVRQTALAKVKATSGSSSKGLAGFATLINNANLSAARAETSRGLRSGTQASGSSSNARFAKSRDEKLEDRSFTVGMIVFLVVGVTENVASSQSDIKGASVCQPMYQLLSEIDISPLALTGLKQHGLCLMRESGFEFHTSDTYSVVESKLRDLFPKLFKWISESEDDDAETSPWLICTKPRYSRNRTLGVFTDDTLPTGFDIFSACQLSSNKVGFQNRVLYLVTRDPVPAHVVKTWQPRAKSSRKSVTEPQAEDESTDYTDDESVSPLPATRSKVYEDRNRVNSEEEPEIIYVKTDSDWDKPKPVVANVATPPAVDTIQDPFNSSLNLGENPWI